MSVTWKQCADLPTGSNLIKNTVINGKVYCGGGVSDDDEYIVYCYDPSQDKWSTLPPLPVRWFGLGHINGKLVAVGGCKKNTENKANDVYTYDERSRKWKQTIPLMPTPRRSPGVLSLQSALVVAGGYMYRSTFSNAADIFKADTSQWYRADPLPTACRDISLVAIGNTSYALGGYSSGSFLNQALYASVDDLLGSAVPANATGRIDTRSTWKIRLPNTPTYRPAAAVLAGNLLAMGGFETSELGAPKREVYMYSPYTNSWIYISDIPTPLAFTTVAGLSSTEVLVIGGGAVHVGKSRVNNVYKGTFTLQ